MVVDCRFQFKSFSGQQGQNHIQVPEEPSGRDASVRHTASCATTARTGPSFAFKDSSVSKGIKRYSNQTVNTTVSDYLEGDDPSNILSNSKQDSIDQSEMESAAVNRTTDSTENTCAICQENEDIHAIAPCNHHICYKCSTRLRLLHQQFYCPICRAECPKVLFVRGLRSYEMYDRSHFIIERKLKAMYADKNIEECVNQLIAHQCMICTREKGQSHSFRNFKALQDHVRKTHQLFYCDICVDNVKLFSSERKSYTRADLGYHKRKGDADDTSFKGHPLCEFCDERFLDTDELWRHLRKDHFFCHFCDADGSHIFFGCYDDVKVHFREDHFLCEEDHCAEVQFTNAFRSEVDLKAHKSQHHLKGVKRSQQRQTRTLDIEFNYGEPRRYAREQRRKPNRDDSPLAENYSDNNTDARNRKPADFKRTTQEELDISRAVNASLQQPTVQPQASVDVGSTQDFPSLGGETVDRRSNSSPANVPKVTAAKKIRGVVMYDDNEEFPGLSSAAPPKMPSASVAAKSHPGPKPAAAPAALKAKSNPWSNTEDEFPSLEGSKPKSHTHGWHLPKPKPKPAMKFINNSRPSINSVADFPSLGGAGAASNLASIGSWISQNGKTVAAAPDIARHQTTSAPEINYYAENRSSSKGKSQKSEHSGQEKEKKSGKQNSAEQSNSNGAQIAQREPSVVKSNSKSGGKKQKSGTAEDKSNNVASTSAKEAARSSKKSDKGKKENKAVGKPLGNQNGDMGSGNVTGKPSKSAKGSKKMAALEAEINGNGPPTTTTATTNPSKPPTTTKSTVQTSSPRAESPTSFAVKTTTKDDYLALSDSKLPTNSSSATFENDYPSLLPSKSNVSAPSTVSTTAKLSYNPKFTDADYPTLSATSKSSQGVANPSSIRKPPGLSKSSASLAPPPGLTMPTVTINSSKKPPGIHLPAETPIELSSLASLILKEPVIESYAYIEPINFGQRNKKLSFKLKELINSDMDKFHKFKNFSSDFRSGTISAQQFYDSCIRLLGEYIFLEILTELLVLLPDLSKQQALYKISKDKLAKANEKKTWQAGEAAVLSQCPSCPQVLVLQDISHHEAQHGANTDFPALSNTKMSSTRKAW